MKLKVLFILTRVMTNSKGATGSWVKIAKAVFWGNGSPLCIIELWTGQKKSDTLSSSRETPN